MPTDPLLFGLPIAVGTRAELLSRVCALLGRGGTVATPNALMLERARRDPSFAALLSDFTLLVPDGVGVRYALRGQGVCTDLFPGVELGQAILGTGSWRLAMIGGAPGVAVRAAEALCARHPSLHPVLLRSGYGQDFEEISASLCRAAPDLVYVAMGVPRQEEWISRLYPLYPRAVYLGLGGSFDVWAGDLPRAPAAFRARGLEWLWRSLRQPRRLRELPRLLSFCCHASRATRPGDFRKSTKTER